jgi:hypothetical protein
MRVGRNELRKLPAPPGAARSPQSPRRRDDAPPSRRKAARALNTWGRRYRRRAVHDLESALRQVPITSRAGACARSAAAISKGSSSRVRSVVNALRSLYRWAQDRELVVNNPAELVRLPAMDAKPRDRVATPKEFAGLLAPGEPDDALPPSRGAALGSTRRLAMPERPFLEDRCGPFGSPRVQNPSPPPQSQIPGQSHLSAHPGASQGKPDSSATGRKRPVRRPFLPPPLAPLMSARSSSAAARLLSPPDRHASARAPCSPWWNAAGSRMSRASA